MILVQDTSARNGNGYWYRSTYWLPVQDNVMATGTGIEATSTAYWSRLLVPE